MVIGDSSIYDFPGLDMSTPSGNYSRETEDGRRIAAVTFYPMKYESQTSPLFSLFQMRRALEPDPQLRTARNK